jgi:hypothetical protein
MGTPLARKDLQGLNDILNCKGYMVAARDLLDGTISPAGPASGLACVT